MPKPVPTLFTVKGLIKDSRLEEALQDLEVIVIRDKYPKIHLEEVSLFHQRLSELNQQNINGLITSEIYSVNRTKLSRDILQFIEQLQEKGGKKNSNKLESFKPKVFISVAAIVIVGIAIIYSNFKGSSSENVIVGKWSSTEIRTRLWARWIIKSEVEFSEDGTFQSDSQFLIEGYPHSRLIFTGDWSLENEILLYENLTIDSLMLSEGLGGINNYTASELANQYLNYDTEYIKTEKVTSYSERLLKTSYTWSNKPIDRTYKRR